MDFELFGIKELDNFFNTLKVTDQRRIVLDAFKIGSSPIIETAKAYLQVRLKHKSKTNNLNKSIGFVPGKGKTIINAKIGARRFGPYKGFHGHLYDAGTTARSTKKGANRGTMIGTHFFTDAVEAKSEYATKQMEENLLKSVDKMIQTGLKKAGKITYQQFKANRAAAGW